MGDEEIAALVTSGFVPVAVDQHLHRRLRGAEGRLFRSLVRQAGAAGHRAQGYYAATAEGRLLAFRHTLDPGEVRKLLRDALARFRGPDAARRPAAAPFAAVSPAGRGLPLTPPRDGLVLDVTTRVLGGYDTPRTARERILHSTLGRDHVWVRPDEAAHLARGAWPASLTRRLARFHFVDNTRGEPPMWGDSEIVALAATCGGGRISGRVRLETGDGERSCDAAFRGTVAVRGGAVTDLDLVARGYFRGHGEDNAGAPRGTYPVGIRVRLARSARPIDHVPPGGARRSGIRRGLRDYLGLERAS